MNPDYMFWVALAAYAFHILEEYAYDWRSWVQNTLKLDADWNFFYVNHVATLFFGIACAQVGWSHPTFSLIFPAALMARAVYFHILTYVRSKRKFSPGMFTAIFLFLPIGVGCFKFGIELGVHTKSLLMAGVCGILVTFFPLFLLKTKNLDFFKP